MTNQNSKISLRGKFIDLSKFLINCQKKKTLRLFMENSGSN